MREIARAAFVAELILLCMTCCQSAHLYRHSWSYSDLVNDCQPWVTVQALINGSGSTEWVNVTLQLSTSSVVHKGIHIHTSRRQFTSRNRMPCLYHSVNGSAFASEIRGTFKVTFIHNDEWFSASKSSSSSEPAIAHKIELDDDIVHRCKYETPRDNFMELKLNVSSMEGETPDVSRRGERADDSLNRRKVSLTLTNPQSADSRKVLELVVVLDTSFVRKAGSEGQGVTRAMEITNYANGFFARLGLQVVLTDIIIWRTDPFHLTADMDDNLHKFAQYKATNVDLKHDTIVLLSGIVWMEQLGLAFTHGMCDRIVSAVFVSDKQTEAFSTSLVLTHEIGHNLGFLHDEEVSGCMCSKTRACIMKAVLTNHLEVQSWSSCSVDAWNSQSNSLWRSCLADLPDASYTSSRSFVCGNGILETGEQCDCGPVQTCVSSCCNAATCQLKPGAACATGDCCDSSSCALRPGGTVCRSAVGPCDVAETCSGSSEWCPTDARVADGVECATGEAYCYKGECKTRQSQCQAIFDPTATTASSECFNLNTRGEVFGHCEKRLLTVSFSSAGSYSSIYSYSECPPINAECGLLHCFQSASRTPQAGWATVTSGSTVCYSRPLLDHSSSGMRSPSFVPNGAKCGNSSMCINSVCTPLNSITTEATAKTTGTPGIKTATALLPQQSVCSMTVILLTFCAAVGC